MIEVKNVSKKYGDFYAVRNLNFTINDGEIIGLLGRNGAGKSTTMNIITGFIEPTDGEIIVDGDDIDRKPRKVKSKIGYMPEGTPLYYDLTVREFVSYMADLKMVPRKEKKAAVDKALRVTGLEKVQKNVTKILSRGYKQRVSMAGAIVGDPKILILDEPTVGLDPKQVIEIRELIKSFRKDHTVIISSHILSEINQMCDKVIIIDKGEIVAIDSPENLEKKSTKEQIINITVEESEEHKLESIKEKISEIKEIVLVNEKEDGNKEYNIIVSNDKDIRKDISKVCGQSDIIILEMKKVENSLEEAFVELIENRVEYSQAEIKKMEYQKEIDELRKEQEEAKKFKLAKKENKAKVKAQKQEEKKQKEEAKKDEKAKKEEVKKAEKAKKEEAKKAEESQAKESEPKEETKEEIKKENEKKEDKE